MACSHFIAPGHSGLRLMVDLSSERSAALDQRLFARRLAVYPVVNLIFTIGLPLALHRGVFIYTTP